jgi:hypothetical protein
MDKLVRRDDFSNAENGYACNAESAGAPSRDREPPPTWPAELRNDVGLGVKCGPW